MAESSPGPGKECQLAADAADARYWLHPTPGGLRSVNTALAHVVLAGELARRPGSDDPGPLLARATALAPGSADVWTGVGAVELERKHPAPAAAAFRRALSVDPGHRTATEGLGRAEALTRECEMSERADRLCSSRARR